jgi:hypothetical protein
VSPSSTPIVCEPGFALEGRTCRPVCVFPLQYVPGTVNTCTCADLYHAVSFAADGESAALCALKQPIVVTPSDELIVIPEGGAHSFEVSAAAVVPAGEQVGVRVYLNNTGESGAACMLPFEASPWFVTLTSTSPSATVTVTLGQDLLNATSCLLTVSFAVVPEGSTAAVFMFPVGAPREVALRSGEDDVCPTGQHFVDNVGCKCSTLNTVLVGGTCVCDPLLFVASPLPPLQCVLRSPFALSPTSAGVREGGSFTVTLTLPFPPAVGTQVLLRPRSLPTGVSAEPSLLLFTADNWAEAKTVTLFAIPDGVVLGPLSRSVTFVVDGTTTDPAFAASTTATRTVSFTIVDVDVPSVVVSAGAVSVLRAGGTLASATYLVALGAAPASAVTVSITNRGPGEVTVSPAALTFSPSSYAVHQTVTVTALSTGAATVPVDITSVVLAHSATDGATGLYTVAASAAPAVAVSVYESARMTLSTSTRAVTVREGGASAVTLALSYTPIAPVTVSVTLGGVGAGAVLAPRLAFPATVELAGTAPVSLSLSLLTVDGVASGSEGPYTLLVTGPLASPYALLASVNVSLSDADAAGLTLSLPSSLVVYEGAKTTAGSASTGTVARLLAAAARHDAGVVDTAHLRSLQTASAAAWAGGGTFALRAATLLRDRVVVAVVAGEGTVVNRARGDSMAELPAGAGAADFSYAVEDDSVYRGTRRVRITAFVLDTRRDAAYALARAEAFVTIVDNDTPGVTLALSASSLVEGESGVATVALTSTPVPGSVVVVSLAATGTPAVLAATTLTFTSMAPQEVRFNVTRNNVVAPLAPLTVTATVVAPTTDAFYFSSALASVPRANASVTVREGDTAGITLVVPAGAPKPYVDLLETSPAGETMHVLLTSIPEGTVTVTLASPTSDFTLSRSSVTLTAATCCVPSAANAVTFLPRTDDGEDVFQSYTVTLAVAATAGSDPDFAAATLGVTVTVTDVGIIAPSALGVEEGASTSFPLQLTSTPALPVTITLTVVVEAWAAGFVSVTLPTSTVVLTDTSVHTVTVLYADNLRVTGPVRASVTLAVDAPVGSGFEGVTKPDTRLYLADNDVASAGVAPAATLAVEGEPVEVTVSLGTVPLGAVTVTLADDAVAAGVVAAGAGGAGPAVFAAGESTLALALSFPADHVSRPDHTYVVLMRLTAPEDPYYNGMPLEVTVTVVDDDVVDVVTSARAVTVEEALGAASPVTVSVSLASQPTAPVTVAFASNPQYTLTPVNGNTVTPDTWQSPLVFVVAAVNDDLDEPDVVMVATASLASSALEWDGLTAAVAVTILDNDVSGVQLVESASPLVVAEGVPGSGAATATLQVRLLSQPYSVLTATGIALPATVVVQASLPRGVCVGPTGAPIFTALCSVAGDCPGRDRTCLLDVTAHVSPASLVFSTDNWAVPQTVAVTAVNDAYVEPDLVLPLRVALSASPSRDTGADRRYSTLASDSLPTAAVTAVSDDVVALALNTSRVDVVEGAGGAFALALAFQPYAGFKVTVASSAPARLRLRSAGAATSATTAAVLTFGAASWAVPQTVEVEAVDNSVAEAMPALESLLLTMASEVSIALPAFTDLASVAPTRLPLALLDNDMAGFVVTRVSAAAGVTCKTLVSFMTDAACQASCVRAGVAVDACPTSLCMCYTEVAAAGPGDWPTLRTFEGRVADTFLLSLATAPTQNVTVTLTSSVRTIMDTRLRCTGEPGTELVAVTDLTIVPATIVFPAGGRTSVTVRVVANADLIQEGPQTATVTIAGSTLEYGPPRGHVCDSLGDHPDRAAVLQRLAIPGLTTTDTHGARARARAAQAHAGVFICNTVLSLPPPPRPRPWSLCPGPRAPCGHPVLLAARAAPTLKHAHALSHPCLRPVDRLPPMEPLHDPCGGDGADVPDAAGAGCYHG